MAFVPLNCHTQFSILRSTIDAEQLLKKCKEKEISSCAITDLGSLSGSVAFFKESKKQGIKPILGLEVELTAHDSAEKTRQNTQTSNVVLLAKNLNGWKNLLKIVSRSNRQDVFHFKPRIDLSKLSEFSGDLILIVGGLWSTIHNEVFTTPNQSFACSTREAAQELVHSDAINQAARLTRNYRDIFGKANVFLGIDFSSEPAGLLSEILIEVGKKESVPYVAFPPIYYLEKADASDHRVLLCSYLKSTLREVTKKLPDSPTLSPFFNSSNYYFDCQQEKYDREAVENTELIESLIESYDILSRPKIPKYDCPGSPDEFLLELCRDGWRRKIKGKVDEDRLGEYGDRVKQEVGIFSGAGLSSYFLIVWDYIRAARERGEYVGVSRGSAGGCLVSYLLDIIQIDPIKHGLFVERFYNAGRNTKDSVSLPDIDTDVEVRAKPNVIRYMREKYGYGRVAQMATFSRLMGRGVLKEVLRIHSACSFEEMNKISKPIPDEAKIADQLQSMEEEGEIPSIVRWALLHRKKDLLEWCSLQDDGSLTGPYSTLFAQAIRLEGTIKSQSKHASGVVIASEDLDSFCPMVHDKSDTELIIGAPMKDAEALGAVKFDVLGLNLLDKIHDAIDLYNKGQM